jgi:DNA-binding transcriptional ArsR family regulator
MQHHPIGSFDWKRIVKRAELPRTTKLFAEFMGDFANADGTGVRPGVELLAKMAGVSTRTVKTHLKALRETGLIEKTKHSRALGQADEYRLTVPGPDHAPVPMRLDPDYIRIAPLVPASDKPSEAVDNQFDSVDETVDDAVDNRANGSLGADVYVKLDAALSETGRTPRGSGLHPSIQTNHYQPSTGSPQVGTSLGAVHTADQGETMTRGGSEPTDAEYAAAYEILILLPNTELLNTVALAELHAAGIADPTVRQIAVRAADIATRPAVPDEHQVATFADDQALPGRGA